MKINFSEQIKKIEAEQRQHEESMRIQGAAFVKDALSTFFTVYPDVIQIKWQQYTPYFNDGDECIFSIREPRIKLNNTPDDAGDYEDGFLSEYELDDSLFAPDIRTDLAQLGKLLYRTKEFLKFTFGDHAKVTATRESIEVEEFEHD